MSLRHSLWLACGIAAGTPAGAVDFQQPRPEDGAIFWCVVEGLRIDGLPLVKHSWCIREGGLIVPLASDEGQLRIFGIRPANGPRPPIPDVYKPLE